MILHLFVVVFFNGFVLMLGTLSVMRGLYALGVCPRPQISIDQSSFVIEEAEVMLHKAH